MGTSDSIQGCRAETTGIRTVTVTGKNTIYPTLERRIVANAMLGGISSLYLTTCCVKIHVKKSFDEAVKNKKWKHASNNAGKHG